ncbi:conserved exported hypothetical protein [Candidatus Sulfopaludibacter sp. SbA3]|nr:conserved exported hypothetical protein [Candidatus Sulfopaludibacter sp. SbA3]
MKSSPLTARFVAACPPLADARGSDQSHDRQGVVLSKGTKPPRRGPWWRRCAAILSVAALSSLAVPAQGPTVPSPSSQKDDVVLPNGKLQKDEILKAELQQNIKDAAQLTELAQQLQEDLEKNDRFVLSLSTLKKTEDIEKLAKKIRSRLRHN